jgi:hypothetical protein
VKYGADLIVDRGETGKRGLSGVFGTGDRLAGNGDTEALITVGGVVRGKVRAHVD